MYEKCLRFHICIGPKRKSKMLLLNFLNLIINMNNVESILFRKISVLLPMRVLALLSTHIQVYSVYYPTPRSSLAPMENNFKKRREK